MDPPKDPRPLGPRRSKNTKEEEDSNKNRKPPGPPGPRRISEYTGKEAPSIPRRKNLMLPPRPINKSDQPIGTSRSSRPPLHSMTTLMQSSETSTSSGLPLRYSSNNSKPPQRERRAHLPRTRNSRSLVKMGSDDTSRRNNVTLPFRLPPRRTSDIVPQNVVRYNGPYVPLTFAVFSSGLA